MSRDQIQQDVIRILRQTSLAGSDRDIGLHEPLGELGLGLDSLALVEFATALEKRFQVELPDQIWTDRGQLAVHHFVEAVVDASPSPSAVIADEIALTPSSASEEAHHPQRRQQRGPLAVLIRRIRRFCHNRESFKILATETAQPPHRSPASPLSLTLREASMADAESLDAFWGSFLYETIDQKPMTLNLFRERLEAGSSCLVAWHEGRIVGMDWLFTAGYNCPYTGLHITWPTDACYGGELYEHPHYQGKGVGLELLAYSLAETMRKGFRRHVTIVAAHNIKMLGASTQFFGLKVLGEIATTRWFRRPTSTWEIGGRSGRGGTIVL